ncbi:response regulator [Candidatus Sumerlaeota bacterium]|nr:response regulator [Candidatus Sumerlaeota bacterium]
MPPQQTKYRIMVVDDDVDMRGLMTAALSPKYEVVQAHDGLDALQKIEHYEPDFIIIDIVMPLMNGFETCQAIRRSPRFMNTQVMFLSGHGSRENVAKSYECGANLFLAKPIDPERLVKNVDVFFQQAGPPARQKKLSFRQIEMIEKSGHKIGGRAGAGRGSDPVTPLPPVRPRTPTPPPPPPPPPQPQPSRPPEVSASPSVVRFQAFETSKDSQMPRVLVAEDDKDLATLINMSLSPFFEVILADDGLDAVEKVVKFQPDIIIVDVMMPKMNGYQLCQSVRANLSFARTPIVFITAKATPKDRDYARRLGADAFLAKPFDIEELVDICQGLTKRPGFRVRQKRVSAFEIHAEEVQEKQRQKFLERKSRQ